MIITIIEYCSLNLATNCREVWRLKKKGCADMRNWFFKGVLPLAFLAFLLYVFKGVYYVDGQIDWFWLWMTAGMPFGLAHFFVVIIPVNMDLTMSL